jgi:GT2 family glycosyltransferase
MSRTSVVVVNYETRDLLRSCLHTLPPGLEVVVVDNASRDGSVEMVRAEFPGVRIVENRENTGYGAGANFGVRACSREFVLVLNSDTLLAPDTIERLERAMDASPAAALLGPRLLNADGTLQPSCFPFPGTSRWLVENEPVVRMAGWIPPVRRRLLCYSPPSVRTRVPWVLGAALAMRRAVFEQVGGFDETFFMYYEEVDLCRRFWAAGWSVEHVPDAEVTHLGGASTSQFRAAMAVEHFRSTLRYYHRYYHGPRRVAWVAMMRAKLAFRMVRDLAGIPLSRRGEQRARLRADVSAWGRALRLTHR